MLDFVVMVFGKASTEFENVEKVAAEWDVGANVAAVLAPIESGASGFIEGSSEKRIGTP